MVKWTEAQEEAIYTSGSDVLVAAAAGSGKTAVLVERIIQKLLDKEDPVHIDELLVVTFTNAAAQEMRNRVSHALEESLIANPNSSHLKKQLSLVQKASISTLHAFCMNVVRQYSYLLDLDPGFRIANDMEADLIKQDVMDDLFEEWYGSEGDEQSLFFAVVDRFSSDRNDVAVESIILDLYTFAMQNPWPEKWLDGLGEVYDIPEGWKEADLFWLEILKHEVHGQLQAFEHELVRAETIAHESDGPYQYMDALAADRLLLKGAFEHFADWDVFGTYIKESKFKRLSGKKTDCNEDKKEQVKKLRQSYKERWEKMRDELFSRTLTSHVKDMQELAPLIKHLATLVKEFKERFATQKKEQAIVDFADLEHYCLELLVSDDHASDDPVASPVAKQLKKQFKEVLVDEYQDTNLVQETILQLVSDETGPGNMFMVGDVKQSIYRFRHAEPTLFIEKYKRFKKEENEARRIDLARNFRSRKEVLIGANYIFRQILDEEIGEIDYDKDAELIYANEMYDELVMNQPEPEMVIIDLETSEEDKVKQGKEDYLELEKAQLEARTYAKKITGWIYDEEHGALQIFDKDRNTARDVQYRDIVILLRSMTWAPVIVEELKKQNIPVYAELSVGYFEAIEVKIMLNCLKVIDNPYQDIPLASILRSPMVGLNEEELAQIRLTKKQHSYYEALLAYKDYYDDPLAKRLTNFLKLLDDFRLEARQGALSELIWHVYRKTGFYDFVGGMPGGRQRQANLRALYDRARTYESTSFRGLFRFLRFIERMEERGDDLGAARALSEQEDVVRIMTVHKSKGLEFPVVIMGGMDRSFNLQDLNKKYLLDKDNGFATKYIDPIKRIMYPTLYFHALKKEKLREQLAEEIRVLYVALTRAKEKLVMVGNVRSFLKKQEKWLPMLDHPEWVLPSYYRLETRSYLDWIAPALIRHAENQSLRGDEMVPAKVNEDITKDDSTWDVSVIHGSELVNLVNEQEEIIDDLQTNIKDWNPLLLKNEKLDKVVDENLRYQYPYEEAARSRAKQTVTEIKRQKEEKDEYSADAYVPSYQASIVKRPNFMQKEKTISAAEKGTAMHTVMQHIPIQSPLSKREINNYIERLVEEEKLEKELVNVIDSEAIERFFLTPAFKLLMETDEFYREVPFSLSLPASDVYANWSSDTEESVLIQGVIDCLIRKDDGWIILDYKTDTIEEDVTDKVREKLVQRYETQMELYKRAVETIWKKPVKKTYLYFFAKQLLITK